MASPDDTPRHNDVLLTSLPRAEMMRNDTGAVNVAVPPNYLILSSSCVSDHADELDRVCQTQ
jgi:hypothetical protein